MGAKKIDKSYSRIFIVITAAARSRYASAAAPNSASIARAAAISAAKIFSTMTMRGSHSADGELHVLHTPGHESGHCCFYDPAIRCCSAGTTFSATHAVIHPPDGNMTDYLKSLSGCRFRHQLICPPWSADGKPKRKSEYIKHRLEREQQVLAALRRGRDTIGDITQMIYVDVSPALQRVAEFSVQAHLETDADGRVKREMPLFACE